MFAWMNVGGNEIVAGWQQGRSGWLKRIGGNGMKLPTCPDMLTDNKEPIHVPACHK